MTQNTIEQTATKRIAAIDLGTNSFHAVIVDIYPDGSFRTVDKLKEMVILAEKGMENHLSNDAIDRGLEALNRIKSLCDRQEVAEILAYATSAIREADNGGDFIQRTQDEVGITVRAIPGKMEAEMIGLAVRHGIALGPENVLMVDIGGGSVEFIVGNNDSFTYLKSLKLGVARMAARFVNSDPISKKDIKALRKHYKTELKEVAETLAKHSVKTIIGSSGTMENIAAMIAGRNDITAAMTLNELVYSAEEFNSFYGYFIKLDETERRKEKNLDEKRVPIINPGMVLADYLIKAFDIENIKISEGALRDGMIINYINDNRANTDLQLIADFPDPRKRSIHELLRKCNWQAAHSQQVAKLAGQLFDTLREDFGLPEADRELLEYAALLHDIGYYISYRKHHKHALYIIRHSDLRGFTEDEINLMAHVARYHRRSHPKKKHTEYKKLPKSLRKRIKKLSAILRVADGLDRSHYQNVRNMDIEIGKEQITLHLTTEGDPELEIWGACHKGKLLEKVTGKSLRVLRKA